MIKIDVKSQESDFESTFWFYNEYGLENAMTILKSHLKKFDFDLEYLNFISEIVPESYYTMEVLRSNNKIFVA